MSFSNLNDSFEGMGKINGDDSFISKDEAYNEDNDFCKKIRGSEFNVGFKNNLFHLNKNIDEMNETFNNNSRRLKEKEINRIKISSLDLERKLDKLLEKTKKGKETMNINILLRSQAKENQNTNTNFFDIINSLKEKETNLKKINENNLEFKEKLKDLNQKLIKKKQEELKESQLSEEKNRRTIKKESRPKKERTTTLDKKSKPDIKKELQMLKKIDLLQTKVRKQINQKLYNIRPITSRKYCSDCSDYLSKGGSTSQCHHGIK